MLVFEMIIGGLSLPGGGLAQRYLVYSIHIIIVFIVVIVIVIIIVIISAWQVTEGV